MKSTELYRDQLGLSQEMMAIYLKLTRSQLSMYEIGKRELPIGTQTKLVDIALFFDQNNETAEQEGKLQKEEELQLKTFLEIQIKDLEYKYLKENRALEKIQKKYNQNLELHAFALYLQKIKESLADVLLTQAKKGMEQNGLVSQTKQKLKLETMATQLDYIQNLKEKQTKT